MAKSSEPQRFGDLEPSKWPGERLGLPEAGQGSVGRIGRRALAIIIDWGLAGVPAYFLVSGPHPELWHLLFFALIQIIFIPTIGGSLGHTACSLRVIPIAGGWVGVWRPIVRTVLLLLVIPVLVWDSDQRGFHDKVAGTVLIKI